MTRHQKRLSAPTSWPVERKTNVFTVKAGAGPHGEAGVPLLVVLRDVLGYVENAKEADYALNQGMVLVNGSPTVEVRRPIGMFDIIAFTEREEYYRVFPDEGGRLALTPISPDDAESKLGKIVGKRQVTGGMTQLSLHDGATLLIEDSGAYTVNDSLIVDNESGAIVAHFPFEDRALVTAVDGSHAGDIGRIEEVRVTPGSSSNIVRVQTDDGEFETVKEYVVVIDENFTTPEDDPDGAGTLNSDDEGMDDEEEGVEVESETDQEERENETEEIAEPNEDDSEDDGGND